MQKKVVLNVQIHFVDTASVLKLKEKVKLLCADESFVHHRWYFEHHLELVERLVNELKLAYPKANSLMLDTLVWFHDLEKILRGKVIKPNDILVELGFDLSDIDEVNRLNDIEGSHREVDLAKTEIEVQILAGADAAAHMLGPFFSIYWYENPGKTIDEILSGNLEKIKRDWERKMVLPEIKSSFLSRKNFMLEQMGLYPDKFII